MYPTTYLQPGSSNRNSVKKLQSYLVNKGYMTQAQMNTGVGIYGPRTTRAVSALQRSLGVDTSGGGIGYFGPRTLVAVRKSETPQTTSQPTQQPTQAQQQPVSQPQSNPTAWHLSAWRTNGKGAFTQQPVLTVGGQQFRFNNPQGYINKMQGLENANKFVNQFRNVTGQFNRQQTTPQPTPQPVQQPTQQPTKQQATQPTQSTTPAPVNVVDQTLKDFNTAIVNKDYTKLKQMGAIPATSTTSTPLPVVQPVQTNTNPITLTTPTATQTPTPTTPTLTPEQVKATALSDRLQALNSSLVGKEAYQAQQNTSAGVDQVQQAINDNNLAIERLNASSGQAQLTAENRLAPMTQITGEQAQIARQRSFQMLGLSAISDALRNNLVSAQNKANEAVQLKYGAIEEQIKADTTNLSLVLNSPQATFDQKKQAQAMIDANRQKANDLIVNRSNQQEVFKVMTLAAQNKDNFTPTSSYPTLSTAMQAITDAKTPQEALVIATNAGLAGGKSAGGFSLSQGQTRYDAQGNVIASRSSKTTVGGINKDASKNISQLSATLELGIKDKGYNGRGADGYVDPNLYIALFDNVLNHYGNQGAAEFLKKYPPAKDINPANVGKGILPIPIENAVIAGENQGQTLQ